MLKTVPHIGEDDRAVGDLHMIDGEIVRGGGIGRGHRPGSIVDARVALAPQRDMQNRLDNDEFGDLRTTGQCAEQRDVGLHAADGQTAFSIAGLGILYADVVQHHVKRRPDAEPGRAGYDKPISGFALDPVLDRLRNKAGGKPDHQQQRHDHNHGGDGGAGDFQSSHRDIPKRYP
jgi:hypothetical protein